MSWMNMTNIHCAQALVKKLILGKLSLENNSNTKKKVGWKKYVKKK